MHKIIYLFFRDLCFMELHFCLG